MVAVAAMALFALAQFEAPWAYAVIAALLCVFVMEIWRRNRHLPPGPWGLPLLGYYPFLRSDMHAQLSKLAEKYGDVMSFRTVGGTPVIVLSKMPVIKEVLVSRAEEFDGRPLQANFVSWFDDNQGIAQVEGAVWKEQRRFFLQVSRSFGFGTMECEPLIHDSVQAMIEGILKHDGKSFDSTLDIANMTSNVIGPLLYRKHFNKEDPRFQQMIYGLRRTVGIFGDSRLLIIGPYFDHILMKLTPDAHVAEQTKQLMKSIGTEIVEEHIRTLDSNHARNFVDEYLIHMKQLEEKGQASDSSFTLDRLVAISANLLLEGTESVGSTLCTLLLGLTRFGEQQKRAQEELDLVIGSNRLVSWADRQTLPYFEALISELFRFYQPFFTSTLYSNFNESTLRGYRIPKRSIIVANYWTINNDPKEFPEPEKFDPGRYLSSDGKRLKKSGPVPYGVGKRSCIGESLAQMEVFIAIAAVLQHFTLYPGSQEGHIKAIRRETPLSA